MNGVQKKKNTEHSWKIGLRGEKTKNNNEIKY